MHAKCVPEYAALAAGEFVPSATAPVRTRANEPSVLAAGARGVGPSFDCMSSGLSFSAVIAACSDVRKVSSTLELHSKTITCV